MSELLKVSCDRMLWIVHNNRKEQRTAPEIPAIFAPIDEAALELVLVLGFGVLLWLGNVIWLVVPILLEAGAGVAGLGVAVWPEVAMGLGVATSLGLVTAVLA